MEKLAADTLEPTETPFFRCDSSRSRNPQQMITAQRAAEKSARHLLEAIGGLREAAGSSFWKYVEICGREGLSKSSLHLMRSNCGFVGEGTLELRLQTLVEKLTSAGIVKAHAESIVHQRCVMIVTATQCIQMPQPSFVPHLSAGSSLLQELVADSLERAEAHLYWPCAYEGGDATDGAMSRKRLAESPGDGPARSQKIAFARPIPEACKLAFAPVFRRDPPPVGID